MKKEEVYKVIQEKISITDVELDKIYNDLLKEFEEQSIKPTEELILNRLYAFLTPALRTTAVKLRGIFLGVEDNFSFNKNVDSVKYDSIQKYKENPKEAIEIGVVDSQGKPLWHYVDGVSIPDFKLGRLILPSDYSSVCTILVRDEVEGKILGYKLKFFTIRGERREKRDENGKVVWNIFNEVQKLKNREVEFMGIEKEKDVINDSKYTKFTVVDDKEVDVTKLLVKYVKDRCIDLKDLNKFYKENADKVLTTKKGDKIITAPVFIRGTVSDVIISETTENNIVSFTDIEYDKQFSIFVPKYLNVPASGTPRVVFGGKLRYSESRTEQPFSMNAFMYYVPENLRNLRVPEIISKYKIIEEEVKDTSASQKLLEEAQKIVDENW